MLDLSNISNFIPGTLPTNILDDENLITGFIWEYFDFSNRYFLGFGDVYNFIYCGN